MDARPKGVPVQALPPLLDPVACGEDLAQLASRMMEIAPRLCAGCAEYHIRFAVTRCVSPLDKSVAVDRTLIIGHIRQILSERAGLSPDPLSILIAGASDTGVLATCAHAAATLGGSLLSRCSFTVIDRCPSPLTLCAEFADTHGLRLRPVIVDLAAIEEHFDADLIVCHSSLRFLDRQKQIIFLKKIGGWLNPDGRLIVSQSLRPRGKAHLGKEVGKHETSLALAKAAIASGRIRMAPEAEPLFERICTSVPDHLRRPGDLGSVEELQQLMRDAGLREYSVDLVARELASAGQDFTRMRAVAVFGSASAGPQA
jgi:hypothetical protein